jgi:hypothetical protein
MNPAEQVIWRESEREANATGLQSPSLAALQMDTHIVKDFLLILDHRGAEELVAHDVGLGVKQHEVGGRHEEAKVVQ